MQHINKTCPVGTTYFFLPMPGRIKLFFQLLSNNGFRYVWFRLWYAFQTKTGWLKRKFPTNPKQIKIISLEKWREATPPFFFQGKENVQVPITPDAKLKKTVSDMNQGKYLFFSKVPYELGKDCDWLTNPVSGFCYDIKKHWSEIPDLSAEAGDIKYVWEKSRFTFLYDLIRYDYHFKKDCSQIVFSEIESFINHNPINQGPNYRCSQEISIRTLNWTFALYYYKNSENLTENLFRKIINHIYWQLHHVYHNINFSRIAVRNNHALTETLMLYLSGLLFPFLPNVGEWSTKGKKWFEEEMTYQVKPDGTFLQFSMNYHRVVIQLLTWAFRLSKLNDEKFQPVVEERAKKSLWFLESCMDDTSGKLSNYGPNDGALFFKLTNDDYRVYRSQLNDLKATLGMPIDSVNESQFWYGLSPQKADLKETANQLLQFDDGGYYIIKENLQRVLTFIRCGNYKKHRPFQNDNLHLDIWVNGINYLRDSGSYQYNTSPEMYNYFNGCEGHNTLSIEGKNQMQKGPRFIWFHWVKKAWGKLSENEKNYQFEGEIEAFKQIKKGIYHHRKINKTKNLLEWQIVDTVKNADQLSKTVYWHLNPDVEKKIVISVTDAEGKTVDGTKSVAWFSGYYGHKEESVLWTFTTRSNILKTNINILQ